MNPFDVSQFLSTAGFVGILVLIFVETGLLVGFIFPGDSLLFTAGVFAAQPHPFAEPWQLLVFLPIAAALGDQSGYAIGRVLGPRALRGRVMRWIGDEPVERTYRFFGRYGAATVLFARFIGIVRTLVPVLAGFTGMSHRRFTAFSLAGSIVWCDGIVVLGYYLGGIPLLRDHLELLFVGSALTIVVPIAASILACRRRARI
ncbi:DedA family protein [Tsukamurella sp. 8F]|uniref:DedA family protein n=1 Tax=unclassified Tsukamurella TaxID=2633480 RepID=UPI0023B92A8E|nr:MULTISPECIES: DedA family protein [unclassified Tsukamurella]MDF0530894.1 DedA family protein [Tsukamurella sp. 8J]MDF0588161.1 DedA family protein [Tsukamurella sp. 8F]